MHTQYRTTSSLLINLLQFYHRRAALLINNIIINLPISMLLKFLFISSFSTIQNQIYVCTNHGNSHQRQFCTIMNTIIIITQCITKFKANIMYDFYGYLFSVCGSIFIYKIVLCINTIFINISNHSNRQVGNFTSNNHIIWFSFVYFNSSLNDFATTLYAIV